MLAAVIVRRGLGPDRYVHVPITGLKTVARNGDTDLAALPEVKLPAP